MPDAIKALYATQDEIPEAFRPLYEEKGGQFHLTKIEGLRTDADVSRVQRALENEKGQHATLKTQWTNFFGERKPEDIQAMLDRIPELETAAAGKLDDDKLNAIVEGRVRGKLAPVERDLNQAKAALAERDTVIQQFVEMNNTRTIHDAVREAAVKAKIIPSAIDDVLMYAERVFKVGEDGKVTVHEEAGTTEGVAPEVWLTEMQQKRPHWWPMSAGGGAAGGGISTGVDNPFTYGGWNLTKQGALVTADPRRAEQMAKAAGTTVGGMKPPKPKG